MSRGGHRAIAAALCVALLGGITACGVDEDKKDVVEGEPIELGDLKLTVQLTRFLNPNDREDAEYVAGAPALETSQDYLGVFVELENESDKPVQLPGVEDLTVTDTTDQRFKPIEPNTIFSVPLGESLEDGGEIPELDTASQSGPIQASLLIFIVDQGVSENRPLELEVEADGEKGTVELDI